MAVFVFTAAPVDFARRQIDPGAWFSVARSLQLASLVLWHELKPTLDAWKKKGTIAEADALPLRLRGPYAMLAGMTIENMLKGLIVQRTPRSARQDLFPKKGKRPLETHNLRLLINRAAVPVGSLDVDLLKRLTTFVTWAGRYPVPLHEAAAKESRILKSDDFRRLAALVERLSAAHLKSPD